MKPPTARQVEVHEAIVRNDYSERRAAAELGVSYVTVHKTEMAYLQNTGTQPHERAARLPSPMEVARAIPGRLDAIEKLLEYLNSRISDHAAAVESLSDRVAELNARQPVLLVERYATHRRQSDGGEGGKAERGGRR